MKIPADRGKSVKREKKSYQNKTLLINYLIFSLLYLRSIFVDTKSTHHEKISTSIYPCGFHRLWA